jgi:urease subunit alpha
MFGASPSVAVASSLHFVAPEAVDSGVKERFGIARDLVPVSNTRKRTKADMVLNDALPDVRVDPDSFAVHVDGELIEPQPVSELPMSQRYFLF